MKEVDRWLELYETHDKYTFIGHLVDDPINDILEHIEEEDEAIAAEEEDGDSSSDLIDQVVPFETQNYFWSQRFLFLIIPMIVIGCRNLQIAGAKPSGT